MGASFGELQCKVENFPNFCFTCWKILFQKISWLIPSSTPQIFTGFYRVIKGFFCNICREKIKLIYNQQFSITHLTIISSIPSPISVSLLEPKLLFRNQNFFIFNFFQIRKIWKKLKIKKFSSFSVGYYLLKAWNGTHIFKNNQESLQYFATN